MTTATPSPDTANAPTNLPRLRGRFCLLRAVQAEDYDAIFRAETSDELLTRWRYRGIVPSPDRFVKTLWEGVLCQFLICTNEEQRLGLVTAYRASHRGRHAQIAVAAFPGQKAPLVIAEGVMLFIEYLFRAFPFRKLYAEVLGFNRIHMEDALLRFFVEEGCLREHEYSDGRWWDMHIFALWREQWMRDATVRAALRRSVARGGHQNGL